MKKRFITTDFWSDGWIESLDPLEKLLYLYTFTNDKCSWSGCTELSFKKMGYETGIDKDMIEKIFKRFEEKNKIKYVNGYVLIKNFLKHHFDGFSNTEKWSSNNQLKAIQSEMQTIPLDIIPYCCDFIDGFERIYKPLTSPLQAPSEGVLPFTSSFTSSSSLPSVNTAPIGATVSKKFTLPTLEQVSEYCSERGNGIDAEAFIAHYDAVGWVYGKDRKPVKDRKACVRTREQKRKEEQKLKEPQTMEDWRNLRDKMGIRLFTEKYGNEKAKEIMLYFL